jgi:hypothetical protein
MVSPILTTFDDTGPKTSIISFIRNLDAPSNLLLETAYQTRQLSKMLRSFVCLVSVFAVSSAQPASVTERVRNEKMVVQSTLIQDRALGRIKTNLRSGGGMNRNLELSMSMSFLLEGVEVPMFAPEATPEAAYLLDATAPTGCMSDEECPSGSSCKCWRSCRFCIAQFSPCGVCEEL